MQMGDLVLVRTYSAGVHFGRLVSHSGREVILSEARRIWRWRGARTLHEVALRGIDSDWSRVSDPVAEIVLTEAIELLPITSEAAGRLSVCGWPS